MTGAARIRRAVALELASSGANVALHYSSSAREVEALAERVAALCLGHAGVRSVDVVVEKLGSLRFARSAAVERLISACWRRSPCPALARW